MEYKAYNSSYLNQVIELLNLCFPQKKVSKASFLWKHYDRFFNNKTTAMVALDNGKICSFVCFVPATNHMEKNIIPNFYSCAVQATHPQYRRRGIVSDLTQLIEKKLGSDVEYFGFSNSDGVKIDKFSKKINYKILGQMATQYVISLPYKTNLNINKLDKIPEPNNNYLDWRYTKNPKIKYEYFGIFRETTNVGYIICKKGRTKYEISALLLKNNDPKLYNQAIKSFASYSLKQGKMYTSYSYLPNKLWKNCLPLLSFKKIIETYFTVKSSKNSHLIVDNWIIQGGDIQ